MLLNLTTMLSNYLSHEYQNQEGTVARPPTYHPHPLPPGHTTTTPVNHHQQLQQPQNTPILQNLYPNWFHRPFEHFNEYITAIPVKIDTAACIQPQDISIPDPFLRTNPNPATNPAVHPYHQKRNLQPGPTQCRPGPTGRKFSNATPQKSQWQLLQQLFKQLRQWRHLSKLIALTELITRLTQRSDRRWRRTIPLQVPKLV